MVDYSSSTREPYKVFEFFHSFHDAHTAFVFGRSLFFLFCMRSYFKSPHRIKCPKAFGLGGDEMSLSTPYLVYILGAYGLTLFGLCLFLGLTFYQWKRSVRQLNDASHEA